MDFCCLDLESEELLRSLIKEIPKTTVRGSAIDFLVKNDYVDGCHTKTLSDTDPCYLVLNITQKKQFILSGI